MNHLEEVLSIMYTHCISPFLYFSVTEFLSTSTFPSHFEYIKCCPFRFEVIECGTGTTSFMYQKLNVICCPLLTGRNYR